MQREECDTRARITNSDANFLFYRLVFSSALRQEGFVEIRKIGSSAKLTLQMAN